MVFCPTDRNLRQHPSTQRGTGITGAGIISTKVDAVLGTHTGPRRKVDSGQRWGVCEVELVRKTPWGVQPQNAVRILV